MVLRPFPQTSNRKKFQVAIVYKSCNRPPPPPPPLLCAITPSHISSNTWPAIDEYQSVRTMYSANRGWLKSKRVLPDDRTGEVLPLYVSNNHQIPRTPQSERQPHVPFRISEIPWLISAVDLINATIRSDGVSVGNNNNFCRE